MMDRAQLETARAVVRSGPLPCSLWQNPAGETVAVVSTAVSADLAPQVVFRDAEGLTFVLPLSEFAKTYRLARRV